MPLRPLGISKGAGGEARFDEPMTFLCGGMKFSGWDYAVMCEKSEAQLSCVLTGDEMADPLIGYCAVWRASSQAQK